MDGAGNLVIADADNNRVRVVAAKTGTFYGQAMTAGHIYTVAGDGSDGFSGDGGPATSAELNFPAGVAVDGAGNLVIADTGNCRIRVVAARTGTFYGQAMTAGDIYTVAGNGTDRVLRRRRPGHQRRTDLPEGVAVDGAGNLVIADPGNDRVRVVAVKTGTFYGQAMTAGDIYTVAGDGTEGFSGDGGPATSAELERPGRGGGGRRGQPGDRRPRQHPGPGGGRQDRQLLRAGDDRRGHLHRRRRRHARVLRRRRPGHQAEINFPSGVAVDGLRQPGDRRHSQQPDPDGGGLMPGQAPATPARWQRAAITRPRPAPGLRLFINFPAIDGP